MNELLYGIGWVYNVAIFLIVLFWLKKFAQFKRKLFIGVKKDLASIEQHELYSCFLTAFCFLIFHLMVSELEVFLVSLEMEQIEKIKLFYTSMIIFEFSFVLTIFCLHLVRGCTFSASARICVYITLIFMMLQGMQLIARGYYDYHELSIVYQVGGWLCNLIALGALSTYPIRSLKPHLKERRSAQ